jgi:Cft2 family RNA processing exonuclease
MIKVIYDRGIYLPELDLWLDPHIRRSTAFISHAHSDHIGKHQEVILTKSTAQYMAVRLRGKRIEHIVPFRVPFEFRGATLKLLPAGHIFGSAQLHVRLGSDTACKVLHRIDRRRKHPGTSRLFVRKSAGNTRVAARLRFGGGSPSRRL